ncbi:unnamed protein product, partial [marine sediment metagenome]
YNYLRNCADQLDAENLSGAATQLRLAANELGEIDWTQSHWPADSTCYVTDALYWIDDNWPENGEPTPPYELTAIKICEAWADNDFGERALTIAFIDRMRQLIWDEPFYVAWAARPTI